MSAQVEQAWLKDVSKLQVLFHSKRFENKHTLGEVSQITGISPSTLSRFENGKPYNYSVASLQQVAKYAGVFTYPQEYTERELNCTGCMGPCGRCDEVEEPSISYSEYEERARTLMRQSYERGKLDGRQGLLDDIRKTFGQTMLNMVLEFVEVENEREAGK